MSAASGSSSSSSDGEPSSSFSPFVIDFEELLSECLPSVVSLSIAYGGHVKTQGVLLQKACLCLSKYLMIIAEPGIDTSQPVVTMSYRALAKALKDATEFRAVKEHTRWATHIAVLTEAAQLLAWTQDANPMSRIQAAMSSFNMYSRYVSRFFVNEPRTTAWLAAMQTLVKELAAYVKRWHLNGVDVGSQTAGAVAGGTALVAKARSSSDNGGFSDALASEGAAAGAADDFYDEVITPGRDKAGAAAAAAAAAVPAGPPRWTRDYKPYVPIKSSGVALGTLNATLNMSSMMLFGKKAEQTLDKNEIVIENQHSRGDLVAVTTEVSVLFIRNCHSCTISVSSSVLTYVSIEDSNKVQLMLDSVSAGVDIANSRGIVITAAGPVGYFDVDKCTEVVLTLGESCVAAAEVFSTACVDLRVARLVGADLFETSVPSRFVTSLKGDRIVSETVYATKDRRTHQGVDIVRKLLVSKAPAPEAAPRASPELDRS